MSESDVLEKFNRQIIWEKLTELKRMCRDQTAHDEILNALDGLESLLFASINPEEAQLSAQISLYPLRQASLSHAINTALKKLQALNLRVIPGSMSTIILGKENQVWAGLQQAFSASAELGELVMIITLSNACPQPVCGEE
jgi:uncharacterized protein YqgV (UPF0045/DUF77 family)